jgi:enoyl-CoA hydratase
MSEPLVRYTQEDKVAVIAMDDGKANALSVQMIDELLAALERAEREAGAVLLTGRPGRFCAGFDLKVMMSGPDERDRAPHPRGRPAVAAVRATRCQLVIAASGHAMAGGIAGGPAPATCASASPTTTSRSASTRSRSACRCRSWRWSWRARGC